MAHGGSFGEFAAIFAFSDGGVVVGDFADFAGAGEVEAGIADVADGNDVVFDDGRAEDAGHPGPIGVGLGEAEDFVVGEGDGFAEALFGGAGLTGEAFTQDIDGGFGGVLPGGVATDTVDDGEDAVIGIGEVAVLVIGPATPHVGDGGGAETRVDGHQRCSRRMEMKAARARTATMTGNRTARAVRRSFTG